MRHYFGVAPFYLCFIPSTNILIMENLALQHHEMNLFENGGSYINCKRIYFSYYKKIPKLKSPLEILMKHCFTNGWMLITEVKS
jgi:hypothetical protein